MSEHPYVIPDPGTCPKCGRWRYYERGEWKHLTTHTANCKPT